MIILGLLCVFLWALRFMWMHVRFTHKKFMYKHYSLPAQHITQLHHNTRQTYKSSLQQKQKRKTQL